MVVYAKYEKSTKKILELIREFTSKTVGYQIDVKRFTVFLHISNNQYF